MSVQMGTKAGEWGNRHAAGWLRQVVYLGCIGNELEQEAGAGRANMAAVQAVGVPVDGDVAPAHGRQPQQSMLPRQTPADPA